MKNKIHKIKPAILVVDDEDMIRDMMKDILDKENITSLFAKNGEEALQILSKNKTQVRLVILDIIMPKMDGIKAYREIRKTQKNLSVLFSSGYTESPEFAEVLRNESDVALILKPFLAQDLVKKIHAMEPVG